MTGFELFFSLFGLILGLAIASIAASASDILRDDKPVKIGWLTPMLVIFLLLDLTSFWIGSYRQLQHINVGFSSMTWAVASAVVYFFAASIVFPKNFERWPALDDYYMRHYRWVIGGVLVANIALLSLFSMVRAEGPIAYWMEYLDVAGSWADYVWFGALGAIMILRNRFVHIAAYLSLYAGYAILASRTPLTVG